MFVSQPMRGTPPNHHQTKGAVATRVRALTIAALRSQLRWPPGRGALRIADVATMDRRNAGRRAIEGSGPESTSAAVAVIAAGGRALSERDRSPR